MEFVLVVRGFRVTVQPVHYTTRSTRRAETQRLPAPSHCTGGPTPCIIISENPEERSKCATQTTIHRVASAAGAAGGTLRHFQPPNDRFTQRRTVGPRLLDQHGHRGTPIHRPSDRVTRRNAVHSRLPSWYGHRGVPSVATSSILFDIMGEAFFSMN